MNIGQAIVLLIEKYEYAKKQDYIGLKTSITAYGMHTRLLVRMSWHIGMMRSKKRPYKNGR